MLNNQSPSLAIVGFGWIGQALYNNLKGNSLNILATVTSKEKQSELSNDFDLPITTLAISTDMTAKPHPVFEQDVLLVCIPPRFKQGKKDYDKLIGQIVDLANKGNTKQIILLNSTAIYQGCEGVVDESFDLNVENEKVKILHAAEQELARFNGVTCVLRLAGLVGPKRHPGRFFKSGRAIADAQLSVNLVHQQDVVNAIKTAMTLTDANGVFNIVAPYHPPKKEFYVEASKVYQQQVIEWQESKQVDRVVSGQRFEESTGFRYQYRDLSQWEIYD